MKHPAPEMDARGRRDARRDTARRAWPCPAVSLRYAHHQSGGLSGTASSPVVSVTRCRRAPVFMPRSRRGTGSTGNPPSPSPFAVRSPPSSPPRRSYEGIQHEQDGVPHHPRRRRRIPRLIGRGAQFGEDVFLGSGQHRVEIGIRRRRRRSGDGPSLRPGSRAVRPARRASIRAPLRPPMSPTVAATVSSVGSSGGAGVVATGTAVAGGAASRFASAARLYILLLHQAGIAALDRRQPEVLEPRFVRRHRARADRIVRGLGARRRIHPEQVVQVKLGPVRRRQFEPGIQRGLDARADASGGIASGTGARTLPSSRTAAAGCYRPSRSARRTRRRSS